MERADSASANQRHISTCSYFWLFDCRRNLCTQDTDDSIVATAIKFEHTQIKDVKVNLNQVESSYQAGEFLAKALPLTLPSTGLLFPLSIRNKSGETGVMRAILSVDENEHSMIFAGDVPEGSYARLMKANFDRLIDRCCRSGKDGPPCNWFCCT